MTESSELSSPFSTGGGGPNFETHVQTAFAVLMLAGGYPPALPAARIVKLKLQGRHEGFETDDLIAFTKDRRGDGGARLLGQIKHAISITTSDSSFRDVVSSAWKDFSNPNLFKEGRDAIALITGPLSIVDTQHVRTILEWARYSEDADDFLRRVNLGRFSSSTKREKLAVLRQLLVEAKGSADLLDDELWRFLKSFHLLGYDLDVRSGVALSLLHSVIGRRTLEDVDAIWGRVLNEVQYANQNAGTLTEDSVSPALRSFFVQQPIETIPTELETTEAVTSEWEHPSLAPSLIAVNLVGAWDEAREADRSIASRIAERPYPEWIRDVREVLQMAESPLSLRNGIWTVTSRAELWGSLASRLFDPHLDVFAECALEALAEDDPKFDLDPDERYLASIHDKVLRHSPELRLGMSESLALLGTGGIDLPNVSLGQPEGIATHVVRTLLRGADWIRWGSLGPVLPLLAEGAPDEFLDALEEGLSHSPCPFDELFSQEGQGVFGSNYLTGVIWALETLAWDERYLVRASLALAGLASRDPGGQWANRPANSLSTIFLPWLPQTTAAFAKRQVAVETLASEYPNITWGLLLSLLPGATRTSSGTRKPDWRESVPEDWRPAVTREEYRNQVSSYAEMAVELAIGDPERLKNLIEHLPELPRPAFERLLEELQADETAELSDAERRPIWEALTDVASRLQRHSSDEGALPPENLSRIYEILTTLAPSDLTNRHRRLFSGRDVDLYERFGDWEEQQNELEERRRQAIRQILEAEGVGAVLELADLADTPYEVGLSLGSLGETDHDSLILPDLIDSPVEGRRQFTAGYIWGRFQAQGWEWATNLVDEGWASDQIGQFIAWLPFSSEAWAQAAELLGSNEAEYWTRARVNPWRIDSDLRPAVEKLMEYGRPAAAIECLNRALRDSERSLDSELVVRVLLQAVQSDQQSRAVDPYNAVELIKHLQADPEVNQGDLRRVEWTYLPLLDEHSGTSPVSLERRIAEEPGYFLKLLSLVYRPRDAPPPEEEVSPQEQRVAANAWRLLRVWRTVPGTDDGAFSGEMFRDWIAETRRLAEEAGYLEVALNTIGQTLIHAPADPSGLWIHRDVAEMLNAPDAEEMRRGFNTAVVNSRGARWVDPSGQPERNLAVQYRKKAQEVEDAGFARFASKLQDLADSYDLEAERIIAEHGSEREEG